MKKGYKFIKSPDGKEREIDWEELNQLNKAGVSAKRHQRLLAYKIICNNL